MAVFSFRTECETTGFVVIIVLHDVCYLLHFHAYYYSDTSRECSSIKSDVGDIPVVGPVDIGTFLAT